MSVMGSEPTSTASISCRSARRQTILSALPATWWFVTTWPSAEMITPLPEAWSLRIRPSLGVVTTTAIRTSAGYTLATA